MTARRARRRAFEEVGSGLFEAALHLTSALRGGWYDVALEQDHLLGHPVEDLTGEPGGSVLEALLALSAGELRILGSRKRLRPDPCSQRRENGDDEHDEESDPLAFLDAVSGGRRWIVAARLAWSVLEFEQTERSRSSEQIMVGVDVGDGSPIRFSRLRRRGGVSREAVWHPCRELLIRELLVRPAFSPGSVM